MITENMKMDKADVKILLLYLLRQLNKISESYNIPIYASGGTCLGMIRHQGMIPWDDDMDFMIFRKDYERFVKACEECLKPPLVLRTRENDPFFCQEFAKICLLDDNGHYTDLSIDIFELDETDPDKKIFREAQSRIKSILYYGKMYKVAKMGHGSYKPKSVRKRVLLGLIAILPLKTMDWLVRKTLTAEKKMGDYVVNWGASYSYKRATYPRQAFGTPQKMPFENTYVWAEQSPEEILKRLYGPHYMQLPPIEKRTDHGVRAFTCSALDMNRIRKEVGL